MSNIRWVPNSEASFSQVNVNTLDEHLLIDEIQTYNLVQYSGIHNEYDRILDLILSNEVITLSECEDPLVRAEPNHGALIVNVETIVIQTLKSQSFTKYLYDKGDFISISEKIDEINWHSEFIKRLICA
ncbi:unnamed protein product [Arctia plantaginis]|uniref:Uncharacterized protein n=1 Tax=Arctia plantaginis TaxID=874455 RepID=A0A8S1AQL7_ARCPL|nr:unnamed protein product [Arctia plantaginis]